MYLLAGKSTRIDDLGIPFGTIVMQGLSVAESDSR